MGARARRGAIRFPSTCLACRARDADEFFRGGVCAECWDRLPVPEPATERCGGAMRPYPPRRRSPSAGDAFSIRRRSTGLRAAAPYRGAARHPARVQVPRRRLPRGPDERRDAGTAPESAPRTRSSPCRRRPGRGGRAATIPRAPSPPRWRARLRMDLARDRVVQAARDGGPEPPAAGATLAKRAPRLRGARAAAAARAARRRRGDVGGDGPRVRPPPGRRRSGVRHRWCFARASRADVEPESHEPVQPRGRRRASAGAEGRRSPHRVPLRGGRDARRERSRPSRSSTRKDAWPPSTSSART